MRVTKIIKTETAHRLFGYTGACSNVHGHSYRFEITLEGDRLNKDGMVVDFKDIKLSIGNLINSMYDHVIVLNSVDPLVVTLSEMTKVHVMTKRNPTAENMALDIKDLVMMKFPGMLYSIKVWETDSSFAEVLA